MSRKRKNYSPQFKAKVALAALQNDEPIAELAAQFEIHPTMINNWKRALIDSAADISIAPIFDSTSRHFYQKTLKSGIRLECIFARMFVVL